MAEYDAIVIGTGTGGEGVIWGLHGAGMKVAAIERELVGGLCAYWGCIPSKTLLRPGNIRLEARHGFGTTEPELRWPEVAQYRNYMVRNWDDSEQVQVFEKEKVDFFRGRATIAGPSEVRVNGQTLRTKRVVIATGSEASVPPIEGLKDAGYWTNREGTALQEIPASVLIFGGGAVGCELGQVLRSYGAEVTIVEEAKQLLPHESPDASHYLQKRFSGAGIALHLGRKATKVRKNGATRTATLDDGTSLSAEVILVATGRKPNVEGLGLDAVGIKAEKKGIPIDDYCRAAEHIWAVGDVTGVAGFTHVADYQGKIACADVLGRSRPACYDAIPSVTYTDPEVASVGIATPERAPKDMEVVVARADLSESSRAETYGKDYAGGLCLLADRKEKVLVGAWAAGPLAGEWIQFASLAIRARIPVHLLDDTILAFPTFTRLYLRPIHELREQLR